MKKILLIALVITGITSVGRGQGDSKTAAGNLMRSLVEKYRPASGLSFTVTYKYAMAASPQAYIDTLSGQFKMLGDRYWFRLDNTETIRTPELLIMLFGEDSIMYLAKPSANDISNPLAMIDSLLLTRPNLSCEVNESGTYHTVVLNFSGNTSYKRIEYRIDKQTGYLLRMVSRVRADHLRDPRSQSGEPTPEAIVEASFNDYRQESADTNLFESARYFRKEGKDYVPVAPFNRFKIFLGSASL